MPPLPGLHPGARAFILAGMIVNRATFRPSTEADLPSIRRVEERAFGRPGEADLSAALIAAPVETISIVAEHASGVVGHVLLSRVEGPRQALALAPLSVDPDWQEMQVGTQLVRTALAAARAGGWKSVFVLGQPDYYCRFGFRSALADAAEVPWQGPHFLAIELEKGALAGWAGPLTYAPPFMDLA